MNVYEIMSIEQLEKHREVLIWMLGEIDLELEKRKKDMALADFET